MASLTRAEVRKTLKRLRALGVKPPRVGYCVTVFGNPHPVELCRHPRSRYLPNDTGYQIVTVRKSHGLFGARRRR